MPVRASLRRGGLPAVARGERGRARTSLAERNGTTNRRLFAAATAGLLGVILGLTSAVTLSAPASDGAPDGLQTVARVDAASTLPGSALETAEATTDAAPGAVTTAAVAPPSGEVRAVALSIVDPKPIRLTTGELYQALARSPWPKELWPEVVRIASCESKYGSAMDSRAEGDGGRALGVLQVRVDVHPDLARDYELFTIEGALAASWVIYQRAGYSFRPWSCA